MKPHWDESKIDRLIKFYPNHSNKWIGARLKVNPVTLAAKAIQLGLRKSPEHLSKVRSKAVSNRKGRKQCVSRPLVTNQ